MIPDELRKVLEKQQYAFIGRHSAIKICYWTKKSLLDEGVCYKQQFYGIKSHRCCQ
ncbi:4-demethylwyosine synthase TYW1, partial [Candidatus Woesearchaeota archaeon]